MHWHAMHCTAQDTKCYKYVCKYIQHYIIHKGFMSVKNALMLRSKNVARKDVMPLIYNTTESYYSVCRRDRGNNKPNNKYDLWGSFNIQTRAFLLRPFQFISFLICPSSFLACFMAQLRIKQSIKLKRRAKSHNKPGSGLLAAAGRRVLLSPVICNV